MTHGSAMANPGDDPSSEVADALLRLVVLERHHGESHPEVLAAMERLGDLFYARERFIEALPFYSRLVQVRQSLESPLPALSTSAVFKLAKCFERLGQFDDAVAAYERAVAAGRPTRGPLYPNLLESYASFLRRRDRNLERAKQLESLAKTFRDRDV